MISESEKEQLKNYLKEKRRLEKVAMFGERLLYTYPIIIVFFTRFDFDTSLALTAIVGGIWWLASLMVYGTAEVQLSKVNDKIFSLIANHGMKKDAILGAIRPTIMVFGFLLSLVFTFSENVSTVVQIFFAVSLVIILELVSRQKQKEIRMIESLLYGGNA